MTRSRHLLAGAGVGLFAIVSVGPLASWMASGGLALHVLQHLIIYSLAASAVVAGLSRGQQQPMRPTATMSCFIAGVAIFWITLLGPSLRLAATAPVLDALQHLLLLGGGMLLALPLVGRRRVSGFVAAVYLLVCEIAIGAAGIVLAWSPGLLYGADIQAVSALGLSLETDQALAGAFILVLEEPLLAIEFAAAFIAGLAADERRQALEDAEALTS